jgi:predicted PurR-regulated permease PerM
MSPASSDAGRRSWRTAGIIVLAIGALLAASYLVRPLFVAFSSLLAGSLLAIVLDLPVRWVCRALRWRRSAALIAVVALLAVLLGLLLWLTGPPLVSQLASLATQLPDTVNSVRTFLQGFEWGANVISLIPDAEQIAAFGPEIVGGVTRAFSSTLEALLGGFLALFIAVYLTLEPRRYIEGALRLVPPKRRERVRELLQATGRALRWWLLGRVVSMVFVGALTVGSLLLMGMPLALGLGLLAGVLGFIPYLGPILAAVPALMVALAHRPILAVYVAVAYSGIQLVENYLITPLLERRLVHLAPVVVLLAQIVLGLMFGLVGTLLATPLTIIAIIAVQMLYIEDQLGDAATILGQRP